ncbi:MAG: sodium:proton antiporter [Rhizobiales bacterium 65-79]|jgi:CPA1 family monovalent cation:H+ antiporter|nr:cation:proton antiporter [Hyphomicrobiales bacterium]OJU01145.1 MAG: sodium:proton antiporter [Rhizobiales bacterium 65-79]
MALFEWTLLLLLGSVLLAGLARRLEIPYPALLAVAGAILAFLPFAPPIGIEPDLALALFVAPVLLDAAFDTSPRDLRRHAVPIASLALVAVLLTTAAVAIVGRQVAGLPIAAAIALGAVVAPPDAAAAAAVLGQFRPPRRILAILQGESLLNDATALLIYRMAVVAAAGPLLLRDAAPMVGLSLVGSLVAGLVLARLVFFVMRRVEDAASAAILQFVSTFGVWIFAERIGLSAIVTMVVYAIAIARLAPPIMPPRLRVSSYSVWETAVFVLNVLAFVLMGLQARPILLRLSGQDLDHALVLAAAVLATVILVRLAFALLCGAAGRIVAPRGGSLRDDILIGWCGMRGLVTLAAAFALPNDFPGRDEIVLAAFCVVFGTLVLQGVTLGPLLRLLRFETDSSVEEEVSHARAAVMRAALASLDGDGSGVAFAVRGEYEAALAVAGNRDAPQAATDHDRLRLQAVHHQRRVLEELRIRGEIGDEAYHRLEEEIDWAELDAAPAGSFQPLTT